MAAPAERMVETARESDPLPWQDPFSEIPRDAEKFQQFMQGIPASRRYVILFTPRSSSTRLKAAAEATGQLGNPGEWFNPLFYEMSAGSLSATSLPDYVDVLSRARAPGGLFGVELTWRQLDRFFGTVERFREVLAPDEHVSLIRHDVVAQAVSVVRLVQTGLSHSVKTTADEIRRSDDGFAYEEKKICNRIKKLTEDECRSEAYFQRFGITPLRLSYEQLSRKTDPEIARLLADHLGVDLTADKQIVSGHQKMAGAKSAEFVKRFRAENAEFLADIDRRRAPILARYPD
ncbi:MAG: Stf0 family sulfotransferase [Paracoccus sp. (in: a-proteobacteria)]